MSDIDVATGLPQLPEGYWWQVGRVADEEGMYHVTVSIVTKHKYVSWRPKRLWIFELGSKRYEYEQISTVRVGIVRDATRKLMDQLQVTPSDILLTAQEVLSTWEKSLEVEKLLGDYPPNKLPQQGEN